MIFMNEYMVSLVKPLNNVCYEVNNLKKRIQIDFLGNLSLVRSLQKPLLDNIEA